MLPDVMPAMPPTPGAVSVLPVLSVPGWTIGCEELPSTGAIRGLAEPGEVPTGDVAPGDVAPGDVAPGELLLGGVGVALIGRPPGPGVGVAVTGIGVRTGVDVGAGATVGFGVGTGVGLGVGTGVGTGVGLGVGVGVGVAHGVALEQASAPVSVSEARVSLINMLVRFVCPWVDEFESLRVGPGRRAGRK
jgi:hypothetical protein